MSSTAELMEREKNCFQFDRNHHGEWKSGQAVGLTKPFSRMANYGGQTRPCPRLKTQMLTFPQIGPRWGPTHCSSVVGGKFRNRCFHIGGKCSNDRLQLDDCHTILSRNPVRLNPHCRLGQSRQWSRKRVTASRGQYIHDTTSDEYFLAKSSVRYRSD